MSTATQLKETQIAMFEQLWNERDPNIAYEILGNNFFTYASNQVIRQGPAGMVGYVKAWVAAFPDLHLTLDLFAVEGELVGCRQIFRGTQLGELYGAPATGKQITIISAGADRIVDGKIIGGWGEVDQLGVFQQIGMLPPLPPLVQEDARDAPLVRTTFTSVPKPSNHKVLLARFNQELVEGDLEAARSYVDGASYQQHEEAFLTGEFGLAELLQNYNNLRHAVPDLRFTIDPEVQTTEGDMAVIRWILSGTHTGGALFGMQPTGKALEWSGIDLARFEGDKIVERWVVADRYRLTQEVGLFPVPTWT
jgi:predicted ester cyclase